MHSVYNSFYFSSKTWSFIFISSLNTAQKAQMMTHSEFVGHLISIDAIQRNRDAKLKGTTAFVIATEGIVRHLRACRRMGCIDWHIGRQGSDRWRAQWQKNVFGGSFVRTAPNFRLAGKTQAAVRTAKATCSDTRKILWVHYLILCRTVVRSIAPIKILWLLFIV